MNTVVLSIEGMTCGHCTAAVSRALQGLDGVERVSVELASGRAEVTFEPGKLDLAALVAAVEEEGYSAAPAPGS